jgi:hypothetical protein
MCLFSKMSRLGLQPPSHPASYLLGIGAPLQRQSCRVMKLTTHPLLLPRLRMIGAIYLLPLYAFMWCGQGKLYLLVPKNSCFLPNVSSSCILSFQVAYFLWGVRKWCCHVYVNVHVYVCQSQASPCGICDKQSILVFPVSIISPVLSTRAFICCWCYIILAIGSVVKEHSWKNKVDKHDSYICGVMSESWIILCSVWFCQSLWYTGLPYILFFPRSKSFCLDRFCKL